jgi:predicted TIM-barrel fold metal-dependent hydrolase
MICDVHAHYIPRNFSDFMGDRFPPRVGMPVKAGIAKHPVTCALEAFGADHLVTGSDYPVLPDYEAYMETFAYIERLGLPKADTDKILHHNAQALFGFRH